MSVDATNQEYRPGLQAKKGVGLGDPAAKFIPIKKKPAGVKLPDPSPLPTLPPSEIVNKVDTVAQTIIPSVETVPEISVGEVVGTPLAPEQGSLLDKPVEVLAPSVDVLAPSAGAATALPSLFNRVKTVILSRSFLYFSLFVAAVVVVVVAYRWYSRRAQKPSLDVSPAASPPEISGTRALSIESKKLRDPGLYLDKTDAKLDSEQRQFSLKYSPVIEPPQEALNGKEVDVQLSLVDKEGRALQVITIDGKLGVFEEQTIHINSEIDLSKIEEIVDTVFYKEEIPKESPQEIDPGLSDEQVKQEMFQDWNLS